jgi:hypothetical protein
VKLLQNGGGVQDGVWYEIFIFILSISSFLFSTEVILCVWLIFVVEQLKYKYGLFGTPNF